MLCQPAPDGTRLSPLKCLLYAKANPLVATVSPGVDSLAQLEGLRVDLGEPGSGTNLTAQGFSYADFASPDGYDLRFQAADNSTV